MSAAARAELSAAGFSPAEIEAITAYIDGRAASRADVDAAAVLIRAGLRHELAGLHGSMKWWMMMSIGINALLVLAILARIARMLGNGG